MGKRVGLIKITDDLIEENPNGVMKYLMSQIIVIRAEHILWNRTVEYIALCEQFDEVGEGEVLPEYQAIARRHPDGEITLTFERL